jgi:hypothetical protein
MFQDIIITYLPTTIITTIPNIITPRRRKNIALRRLRTNRRSTSLRYIRHRRRCISRQCRRRMYVYP